MACSRVNCSFTLFGIAAARVTVGIATCYELDSPGEIFSILIETGPEAHPASCKMDTRYLSQR